jgi:hypothetical protein
MKANGGVDLIAPHILNPWYQMEMVTFTPELFYSWEKRL